MKTRAILGGAAILVAGALGVAWAKRPAGNGNDQGQAQNQPAARPKVEVVFVLDTTGSMSGLIQGAKDKIWSISRHIASGQPRPEVKIGLVAYRDVRDAYVTRKFALSSDLDGVYENLKSFSADGGGDTPEHVAKGLNDAVYGMDWSKDSMKMIFLVGDAPPHTDYQDGLDYEKIIKEANKREIRVHAIRCGDDGATAVAWGKIARLGRGTYASIAATGGVVAIATPHDAELAELGRKLNDTAIIVGDDGDRARVAAKAGAAASAPAPAAADRAGFYAVSGATIDEGDSTDKPADVVAAKPAAELPAEMRPMTVTERKDFVGKKKAERAVLLKEMEATSAKRDAFIRQKTAPKAEDGFDDVVEKAVSEQGKAYGLKY